MCICTQSFYKLFRMYPNVVHICTQMRLNITIITKTGHPYKSENKLCGKLESTKDEYKWHQRYRLENYKIKLNFHFFFSNISTFDGLLKYLTVFKD